jgi:hypothetical protein
VTWDSFLVTSSRTHASQRERIMRSICPVDLVVAHDDNPLPTFRHECQRPRAHSGWHRCWCGGNFGADGTVFYENRLPGQSKETS